MIGPNGSILGPPIPGVSYPLVRTPHGISMTPSGKVVALVRATGVDEGDSPDVKNLIVPDINTALNRCRAGKGDIVLVAQDHTENVDGADDWSNLKAGTKIIGLGSGCGVSGGRPTLTWSTAASTILLDQNGVYLDGFNFEMAGPAGTTALAVAQAMTISGNGIHVNNCFFHTEIDADQQATIGMRWDAADDLTFSNCYIYGSGDGSLTATILIDACDRLKMVNCVVDAYSPAVGTGIIQFVDAASYDIYMRDCQFSNRLAASEEVILFLTTCTGRVINCDFFNLIAAGGGITLALTCVDGDLIQHAGSRICNTAAENAGAATTVSG